MQLSVLEAISGDRQQCDKAGVHQQALRSFPAGTHAHHVVQEHLRKGTAGKSASLQQPCIVPHQIHVEHT